MTDAALAASDGPDLSEAEQKYFESGGESVEGLVSATPPPQQDGQPQGAGTQTQQGAQEQQPDPQVDAPQTGDGGDDPEMGDDGKPKNRGQWVRHGALHEEREKRKAVESRLREYEEKFSRTDERLKLINEALQGQAQQAQQAQHQQQRQLPAPPNPEEDPFGYMRWQDQRAALYEQQLQEMGQYLAGFGQMTVEQQQEQALRQAYTADAQQFRSTKPDFMDAYQFVLASRDKELALLGYDDPQVRMQMIVEEERALAARMLGSKKSAAERVYNLAVERGYKPVQPNGNGQAPAPNGNGAAVQSPPAQQQQQQAKPGALEAIERIQQGQQASRSLSNAGGSPGGQLTPEILANMPQDQFAQMLRNLTPSQERELFGG